jgi:hypothetical protein
MIWPAEGATGEAGGYRGESRPIQPNPSKSNLIKAGREAPPVRWPGVVTASPAPDSAVDVEPFAAVAAFDVAFGGDVGVFTEAGAAGGAGVAGGGDGSVGGGW